MKRLLVILHFFVFGQFASLAQDLDWVNDLPAQASCGVTSAVALCTMLNVDVSSDEVVDLSFPWGHAITLKELKTFLSRKHIKAQAVHFTGPDECLELLKTGVALILHYKVPIENHYVAVRRIGLNSVQVFDYPACQTIGQKDFIRIIEQKCSGYAIVAGTSNADYLIALPSSITAVGAMSPAQSGSQSANSPASIAAIHKVELQSGDLIRLPREIVTPVPSEGLDRCEVMLDLENHGQEKLHIGQIFGSCSCFTGPDLENFDLEPKKKQTIRLRFDAKRVRRDNYTAVIAISSSDLVLKTALVTVRFRGYADQGQISLVPQSTSFGMRSTREMKEMRFSLVDSRKPISQDEIFDLEYNHKLFKVTQSQTGLVDLGQALVKSTEFLIQWQSKPVGLLNEEIRVHSKTSNLTFVFEIHGAIIN